MKINPITYEENVDFLDKYHPIVLLPSILSQSDIGLEMHWHPHLEIIQNQEDSAEYIINGFKYIANKGDFIIVNPKQVHQAKSITNKDIPGKVMIVDYNLMSSKLVDKIEELYITKLVNNKILLPNYIHNDDPLHIFLLDIFNQIEKTLHKNQYGIELKTKALLFDLLYIFLSNNRYYENTEYRRKLEKDNNDFIRKTIDYIHSNYSSDLNLDTISEAVNVSKFHLCRAFKDETGQTINSYINHYRLVCATKLLDETDKDITEITIDVGFNNPSYFISRFKQVHGITPNKYRKSIETIK